MGSMIFRAGLKGELDDLMLQFKKKSLEAEQ